MDDPASSPLQPVSALPAEGWPELKKRISVLTGWDLERFKENYLKRRVTARVRALGLESWAAYGERLSDAAELERLKDRLTVNVTEFFRDLDLWQDLEEAVLPVLVREALARKPAEIRIWSAGCSSGEEPYSVAMLALEAARSLRPAPAVRVLASDLDPLVLQRAKEGRYPAAALKAVSKERLEEWFVPDGALWSVGGALRSAVAFRSHNLFAEPPPPCMDLVLCRNVMIYFSRDLQQKLIRGFRQCLRPGAFYVTGKTETLLGPARLGWRAYSARTRIFQKA